MRTPKAPDPVATAQAQAGYNRDTALTQQMLNMVDTTGPWGSVTYSPNGTQSFIGSDGKVVTIPRYTQTTSFSPEQQQIYDQSQQAEINLSQLAADQSAMLQDYLSKPFEFDNQDAEQWAYDLASPRILEQQGQNEKALRARLINAGLRPGSAGWDAEMTRLTNANTDQLNQLALTGRGQAFAEALATRNQPINEITALLSGSQVSNPASMSGPTPQTQVGGVDYAGMVQQNYQNQLNSSGGLMGGLFGLAGALGGGALSKWSDRRLKTEIRRVGTLDNGLPVYAFKYRSGGPVQIGLMAQDVEAIHPEAVTEGHGGFKMVNYGIAVQ
ncbi:tail fiber domain-containing protein [Sphingopyxis sp. 113P3]|uniref:tail fiber domain-containing protein n=1 Tax=Sphingopyxis sp. (strain 113P3) TaxID=292913 RepID=UPI0006AD5AC7|nr:tail fiber domain-containing protein [Sphingopyxis sp. 113P3]ALC11211.1 hypothetical protein LH20_04520 [Sphingopyxis sp. 113P3]